MERFHPPVDEGLSAQQVRQRKEEGLRNTSPQMMTKTNWQIIRDNVFTLFNAFNVAVAVCIALVGAYENLLFLLIIGANTLIGIIQEIRSKKTVEKLSVVSMPHAKVMREGKLSKIDVEELVLDDIIQLEAGHQVCADAIVEDGRLEVSEALLTGEADPIPKQKGDTLLSGSFVISGTCRAKVEHVGADNYATKITLAAKKHKKLNSELMNSLNKVVKFTSYFIVPVGLLLFARSYFLNLDSMRDAVVATSAALLGMLPKGLVLLTSVSLAVGVIKLARKKTLVQELFCIETLSRVDMLCLDKTGTLTQGEMTVTEIVTLDESVLPVSPEQAAGMLVAALQDNNATFQALQKRFDCQTLPRVLATTPFSSARKWSSATIDGIGTIVAGAPEILMKGKSFALPEHLSLAAQSGTRVLLLAHTKETLNGELKGELSPVAAIALKDPIRPDARETLAFFHQQDVAVKVISGDNPVTVSAIARQAGLKGYQRYIDMSTVETDQELFQAAKKYTIFGRVSPNQKCQLIKALKRQGHTVAMTGDGVNDVLALKEADCSIAMAAGSDAARQVSQLVLLDSQFSSLPDVVMEGRRVVNNITRTAALFLMKTCFSFLLSLLTVFTPIPYPFAPIQLSLVGTAVEGIPAFFLAFEPNRERIRGSFLSTVLLRAFPTGLLIVLFIVITYLFAPVFGFGELDVTTLNVYLTGSAGLALLLRVCLPLTKMRAVLWGAMTGGFFVTAYLFRDLLGLGTLGTGPLIYFLVLTALCYPLTLLASYVVKKLPFLRKAFERIEAQPEEKHA